MDPRFHPSNFFRPKEALMNSRLLSIPLALTLVACGGNNNAVSRNNPGTGTSTLRVQADVDATPRSTDLHVDERDSHGNSLSAAPAIAARPPPEQAAVLGPRPLQRARPCGPRLRVAAASHGRTRRKPVLRAVASLKLSLQRSSTYRSGLERLGSNPSDGALL